MADISPGQLNAELRRRAAQPFPDEIAGSFGVGLKIDARAAAATAVVGFVRHKQPFATQAEAERWLEQIGDGLIVGIFSLPAQPDGATERTIIEKFGGRALVSVVFPVDEYAVLLEHAVWPSHQQRGPHDLHATLHRYGGRILGFLVFLPAAASAPKRRHGWRPKETA